MGSCRADMHREIHSWEMRRTRSQPSPALAASQPRSAFCSDTDSDVGIATRLGTSMRGRELLRSYRCWKKPSSALQMV